jgi:hypothetical protein
VGSNWILANVLKVVFPIFLVANSMIGKSLLPDLTLPIELALCSIRKTPFDQLHRLLDRD